jgi:dTMP kinase
VAPRLRVWDLAERAIPDQMPEVLPALPTAVEWLRARWVRSETPPSVAEQEKYMALLVEACPEGRERAHYSAWWAARGPVHVQTQAPSVTTADAQAPSGVSASTVSASAASVPTDAPSPPRGQWIVLDGPDGAGKTTVIQALHEALVARGVPARNLREPGGEPVAEQVRAIVRAMPPREGSPASAFLFAAARALMVDGVVKPALETGEWVLVDRGAPSTIVYQGEEGLARPMLEQLSIWAHGGVQPDVTILLTADPAVLAERVGARGDDGDARDTTSVARLTARATAYLALASSLNAIVVDTNRPVSAIVDEILAQLQARGLPLPEPLDGPSPPMVVADHAPPRARTPVA